MWQIAYQIIGRVISDVDFSDLIDRASGTRLREAQHSRAHVVSALNDALPSDRKPWTTQNLFLFIGAFAKVEHNKRTGETLAAWLRPSDEVVSLLLRGVNKNGNRAELETMLADECNEVFAVLPLLALHTRDQREDGGLAQSDVFSTPITDDDWKPKPTYRAAHAAASVLFPPYSIVRTAIALGLPKKASQVVSDQKRHMRDRKIVDRLAGALLDGGLSSRECRDTLLAQGLDEKDVDGVLSSRANKRENS